LIRRLLQIPKNGQQAPKKGNTDTQEHDGFACGVAVTLRQSVRCLNSIDLLAGWLGCPALYRCNSETSWLQYFLWIS